MRNYYSPNTKDNYSSNTKESPVFELMQNKYTDAPKFTRVEFVPSKNEDAQFR